MNKKTLIYYRASSYDQLSDNLLVYSVDRLARNYRLLAKIQNKIADSGVRLTTVVSPCPSSINTF